MRAKFKCTSLVEGRYNAPTDLEHHEQKYNEQISFMAVYSSDPTSENYSWSKATPCASLSMTIDNPGAWGRFKEGQEYFLDFTPVEAK